MHKHREKFASEVNILSVGKFLKLNANLFDNTMYFRQLWNGTCCS